MTESREKKMDELLRELREESPGIEAAVLISSDAMPLASDVPEQMEEQLLSAMASSLIASSERVAGDLSRGDVEQVYVKGESGDLIVVKVNDEAVLACTVDHLAKMGLTMLEVDNR